jgi:hypothetical protein
VLPVMVIVAVQSLLELKMKSVDCSGSRTGRFGRMRRHLVTIRDGTDPACLFV